MTWHLLEQNNTGASMLRLTLFVIGTAIMLASVIMPLAPHGAFAAESSRRITIDASDYQADFLNMAVTITDLNTKTVVFKGYTPVDFAAHPNDGYQVSISGGYGTQFYFDHWSDVQNYQADTLGQTGNATGPFLRAPGVPFRYVPADINSYDLHAVYRTDEFPIAMTPLKIDAVDQNGKELAGMYVILYACDNPPNNKPDVQLTGCQVSSSGWTPYPIGIFSDFPYYVSAVSWHTGNVSDTGEPKAYLFDHWVGGTTGLLPKESPPATLTAVYNVIG